VPVLSDPLLYPPARTDESRAGRATGDARNPFTVFAPEELKTEKGEPSLHGRVETTERHDTRLLRCYLKGELPESCGKRVIEPLRILPELEGADEVVGITAYQRLPVTAGLYHLLEPEIHDIVQIQVGDDG